MDDEALSLHVGPHFDMLPTATNGSFELIRKELCSLQNALQHIGEIMRRYEHIEWSEEESIKSMLRQLYVALNELREYAERQGSNSGYTSYGMGYDGGTQVKIWRPPSYESFQSFQRILVKAIERAKLKLDSSTRCNLESHRLENYSYSASHTLSVGERVRSITHRVFFCRHCERSVSREFGVFDVSCLILGKILCPPLQWLFLQSLQFDLPSTLDQNILHLFPSIHQLVSTLSHHDAIVLSMNLVSTSLTVLAIFIPFSHIGENCRSPVFFCCWLALVASGPLWTYIGGSAASFFLVFMPYAMSVGISIGLLWYRCVRKRGYPTSMEQEELKKQAGSSDIAHT